MQIICLLAIFGIAQLAFSQTGNSLSLTAEQRSLHQQSLEKVWKTVREQHWDPALGGIDWDGAYKTALSKLQKATTAEQSRAVISDMLATLGKSHFAVFPSDLYKEIEPAARGPINTASGARRKSNADASKRDELCGVGLTAAFVEGTARVVSVDRGSPADRAGIRMGWEVISVDDFNITATLKMLASSDLRERELYEHSLLEEIFLGYDDETLDAVFTDGQGIAHKVTLERTAPKGNLAQFGFLPKTRVWIEANQLEGPVGFVRFNIFLDPEQLMPAFEKAVRDCKRCQGFVIDLRGNPGGIGAMSMGMAGWFVPRKGRKLGTLKARDYTTDYEINPRIGGFEGPLAILVDGGSASTSEILAAGLQDLSRARIFGTKTAGAALPSVIIRLPSGDGFQYAEANYVSRNGHVLEGEGVTPDVIVKHTRESLLAGRDAVLDAALDWIRLQK